MSVEKTSEKPDGKVEFDVIEGGKYKKRVTRGVLYEDNLFMGKLAIAGSKFTVFSAAFALTKHISDEGWSEEFEMFAKFMAGDKSVVADFEKFLKNQLKM